MKRLIIIIAIFVAIFTGGYFAAKSVLTPMIGPAERFTAAISAADASAAHQELGVKLRGELSEAELQQMLERNGLWGEPAALKFTRRTRSGGEGEGEALLLRSGAPDLPVRFVFSRESGAWRIVGFHYGKSDKIDA